jgi:hypothetical protein
MTDGTQAQVETPAAPATPAEAATRLDQLKADPNWTSALLSGAPGQTREFHDLHRLVAKGDSVDMAMAGVLQPGGLQTSDHMELIGGAAALRALGIQDGIIKDVLSDSHTVTKAEFEATKQWKADQMSNPDWVKLYMGGDNEARRKMTLANIILTGGIRESAT